MKKLLLALALSCAFPALAAAQCVGAGSPLINALPGAACASEPTVDSFGASGYGIVPAASATDIACITGSATKVIRVQRVIVSGIAGTAITPPVVLTKHTVANTGGTAAATTALPVPRAMDSNGAAATATTTAYTANPTVDASALQLAAQYATFQVTTIIGSKADFDFSSRNYAQAPVLRGIAQQVCVNLGATSITSGLLAVAFYWTEQAQ